MTNSIYSNISIATSQSQPIDPIEIFQKSAVTDDKVNDLWLAQGDALREWHDHRSEGDVAVVLNTGAGKTLVGLLIAQSLVNETQRQVVYVCSSIQLVQQTADKARGYGLPIATYFNQSFSPSGLYQRAEGPCVTTYQAMFNGLTRFKSDDLAAVVFDDAHTAEQMLRDQFSLSITQNGMDETYRRIWELFRPYHQSVGLATSYSELLDGEAQRLFLVPPSEVHRNINELRLILGSAGLDESLNTKFSWAHIRDHEELCCLLISTLEATLTPPVVPVSTLPYFNQAVRRIYLSATLSAPDNFVRAFGREPDTIVAPFTTAGECERMILIPSECQGVEDDVAGAQKVINDQKTLILVPNFYRAGKWSEIASVPRREEVPNAVNSFRDAGTVTKLALAARYDGIDFPGDTCRTMVVDDLPNGTGPLERFQWESLNMQNSHRSLLASRVVQSFGRISRGMSDHGVVVITGERLVEWLQLPRNRVLLPEFLQKQIKIGEAVSKSAYSADDLIARAKDCLSREPGWVKFYTDTMRTAVAETEDPHQELALKIAVAEARFAKLMWDRDFQRAAATLNSIVDQAIDFSQYTGAWLSLWLGFALEMDGDEETASFFYRKAHALQSNFRRPLPTPGASQSTIPEQVIQVAEQMRIGYGNSVSTAIPKTMVADLAALDGSGSTNQTEEALRCLGQYLGLTATRPDNDPGTGPDVLWINDGGLALCIEMKTCKQETSSYRKEDVAQLHDHIQWVKDNHELSDIIPVFVGPSVPASADANPSPEMQVIELQQFHKIGQLLIAALQDVAASAIPLSLRQDVHKKLQERGLMYPDVLYSLDKNILNDLGNE